MFPLKNGDLASDFTLRDVNDAEVTAALIVAKRYLGSAIQVRSDGDDHDWEGARQICQAVLGYGQEFHLGDDGLVAVSDLAEARPSLAA